ncbi:MAG: sulfatase-like hydrolase/transferase [Novosphingobium sp.]|nr:sulfatase-like hydrolase/transferase [Novosphingobium sp.]
MKPPANINVTNFGFAAAIVNCSAGANASLRFGGTRKNFADLRNTGPSIWAYARKAGLSTVYIEGQGGKDELLNLMTLEERGLIDEYIQKYDVPIRDRDMAIVEELIERLGNDHSEFIYVNKVGGHFPLNDRYPDSHTLYRPALPRNAGLDGDGLRPLRALSAFRGGHEQWRRYRNSYRNTLLWNVGEFFDRLLNRASLDNATIIYTADHGQDLHERRAEGIGTHCGSEPVPEEGLVPLVIIEGAKRKTFDWERNLESNHNGSSAFHIFPTLIELMGYDHGPVRKTYGLPLHEAIDDPMTFTVEFDVLPGKERTWHEIDLSDIAAPPVTDYIVP